MPTATGLPRGVSRLLLPMPQRDESSVHYVRCARHALCAELVLLFVWEMCDQNLQHTTYTGP
jgi:hypothetical protein